MRKYDIIIQQLFFPIIIIGDLLYDDEISSILLNQLDNLLKLKDQNNQKRPLILVGDPGRPYLDSIFKRLKILAEYDLPEDFRCTNGLSSVQVYKFD